MNFFDKLVMSGEFATSPAPWWTSPSCPTLALFRWSMNGKGNGKIRLSLILLLLGLTLYFSGHGGSDTGTNYQVNIEMLMMEKIENSINYQVNIEHVIPVL